MSLVIMLSLGRPAGGTDINPTGTTSHVPSAARGSMLWVRTAEPRSQAGENAYLHEVIGK